MESVIRRSGIDVIGAVPWGTHFCQFYEIRQDLIETLVPYFKEGLAANEFCMWVTSEPLQVDQATAALRAAVPDLDEYIRKGQIEILDYSQWYTLSGKFSANEVLQGWVDKLNAALEKGYEGLRLTGNTFWLEQADWDDFTRYEEAVNNVIGQYRMLAICTYCLQKCSALEILDVVTNHQFALIKRSGRWQIIKSAQQEKTAQALQESELRYATTLASIGDAVIATDVGGRITFMNTVAEKLTGWSFLEASMLPVTDVFNIINEYSHKKVNDPVAEVLRMGVIVGLANHTILIRKDGTEVAIDDSGAPIKDRDGNTSGVVLVFRDITERKQSEEMLQQANERLELAQRASGAGVWDWDIATGHIEWSSELFDLFGLDPQKDIASFEIWNSVLHPEDLVIAGLRIDQALKGRTNLNSEYRIILPDGQVRWINALGHGTYDDQGSPVRMIGTCIDITGRKKMEEDLRNSERLYRAIGESIDYGVWVCDPDGRNIYASPSFLKLLGITQEQCSDFGWGDTLHPDDTERTIQAWKKCVQTEGNWDIEHRFRGSDGQWHDILARGVPVKNDSDKIICWAGINLDINRLKRAENELRKSKEELEKRVQERTAELSLSKEELECMNEELRVEIAEHRRAEEAFLKAKEAAEAAAEAKTAFLANMSHELRTPMNAVIGFTSLLLDEDLSLEHKEFIEGIRNGGEAMMTLINDILDFSRTDKEKIKLEHGPISIKHLIEESLDMVAVEAAKKGLGLAYTVGYGTPDTIIGDHGRLRQILVNLLSNAVKFTDKGDISVSVSSQAVEGNKREIFFSVKDTGIGIPQDKMSKIFEPFTQLERTISRKRDGVGLGLAITKNLVDLMEGTIWAESIVGQGTTFHVMIRAETIPGRRLDFIDASEKCSLECVPGKKALRILIAEDNPSNQKVLLKMLKRMGYRPDAVADGLEAVQALERLPYDLILMDVRMPEMDGITATRVIRRLRPDGPKIVAITAYALEGDRETCIEAGMDDYISKPVQKKDLEAILIKYSREMVE